MSKKVLIMSLIGGMAVVLCSYRYIFPSSDDLVKLNLVVSGLQQAHYSPQTMDDAFAERVFDLWLKRTDYSKKFLTQNDVNNLTKSKTDIDNQLKEGTIDFFDKAYDLLQQRITDAEAYYPEILSKPFDFSVSESIESDNDKLHFEADTKGLKEAWRKTLKYQTLIQFSSLKEDQQNAIDRKDSTMEIKSDKILEASAREKVLKANADYFSQLKELDREDWLAIYINCIVNAEDPHSEYFPPADKANFDIQMTGQFQGIGATLQQKDGNIKVTAIVPGSASWRQGDLKAGDIILKVAQGSAEPVSIEGMRLDKAILLIRGTKGTEVRLTVKKQDGSISVIPIIRDVVILEDTYAQSYIIETGGKKIGLLKLPGFYEDFSGQNGNRSCAVDVKKELLKLETEKVDAIIFDVRDNGGGSLSDVVTIGGYFISKGPIVQVKDRDGKVNQLDDTDPKTIYDGPLVVMVNENSASASEIFAAAMQDYNRAVIIGSTSTHGKGTVQQQFNLDDYVQTSSTSIGQINITTQKFYRINGGSTQLKGVTPDIILPDPYSMIPYGEHELDFPLPWDQIKQANYSITDQTYDLKTIIQNSSNRTSTSNSFKLIGEEQSELSNLYNNSQISLNYDDYKKKQADQKADQKLYDAISTDTTLSKVYNLTADLANVKSDTVRMSSNKETLHNILKDVYLYEATQVLGDMMKSSK